MSDLADQAAAREQQDLALALQQRKPAGPAATGHCLSCGEPLCGDLRWCDRDCRDDWQRAQAAHQAATLRLL